MISCLELAFKTLAVILIVGIRKFDCEILSDGFCTKESCEENEIVGNRYTEGIKLA